MLFIQAKTIWKITNKDIIKGNSKLTYFNPGEYSFKDNQERLICFDFINSCIDYKDNNLLEVNQYSLDYDYINDYIII